MTLVSNPDSSHINLCKSVTRLLRKDRPILSDITNFQSICEIHGLLLKVGIFVSSFQYRILRGKVFGLNPEPKTRVPVNIIFYKCFVPTDNLIKLQTIQII